ncbi:ATP-NAD kinase [Haloplanus halobius]|uniref:ATP-NAD kinase n=1 Tax=Haloplanus halobius TaxID=2934938 RepID=UPI00200DA490
MGAHATRHEVATVNVAVRGGDGVESDIGVAGATLVDERDADAVVVVGADALRSVATDPPTPPILPITAEGGRHLVERAALVGALAAVGAGDGHVEPHPILGVRRDGTTVTRALQDVTLMTVAPGSISEYAVDAGKRSLESVRADGIVVATPLGSDGYAAAAGGPVIEADTGVSVVPVAPFITRPAVRVADPEAGLTLSVEREGDVALFVDGVRHGTVAVDTDLRIDRVDTVDVVAPQQRTETF